MDIFGKIKRNQTTLYADRNNCRSEQHIQQWLLINDLLNVSAYLNGDWTPDWNDPSSEKHTLCVREGKVVPVAVSEPCHIVYFKDADTAAEALRILGEPALRQILSGTGA